MKSGHPTTQKRAPNTAESAAKNAKEMMHSFELRIRGHYVVSIGSLHPVSITSCFEPGTNQCNKLAWDAFILLLRERFRLAPGFRMSSEEDFIVGFRAHRVTINLSDPTRVAYTYRYVPPKPK